MDEALFFTLALRIVFIAIAIAVVYHWRNPKWEYKVIVLPAVADGHRAKEHRCDDVASILMEHGWDRWELVGLTSASMHCESQAILKRRHR